MDPIRDFAGEVDWVLEACAAQVGRYPGPLRESGLAYLERRRLLKGTSKRSGIVYLLPFWLSESLGLSQVLCRQLALADTFGLLHYFVQDEIMDSLPGKCPADLLPLANLFFLDALAPYRALFPTEAAFWRYFDGYVAEWAASVAWERREHWERPAPFGAEDLPRLAGKSAPLKIPSAAAALLAERPELVAPLAALIDDMQVVFQLIDDLRDWREDLVRGNFTYFLTAVVQTMKLPAGQVVNSATVEASAGLRQALAAVFGLAQEYNRRALARSQDLKLRYLVTYIEDQDRRCRRLQTELLGE